MTTLSGALQKHRGDGFVHFPPFVLADIERVGARFRVRGSFRPAGAAPVEVYRAFAASEPEARRLVTAQVSEAQHAFPSTRFFLILAADDAFLPMALFDPASGSWEKVLPTRWSCPRCGRARTYTRVHGVLPPLCCGAPPARTGAELGFELLPNGRAGRAAVAVTADYGNTTSPTPMITPETTSVTRQ